MKDLVKESTRCLLVQPMFSRNNFLNYRDTAKFVGAEYTSPPLGLMTVAALLPQHWRFALIDENVGPLEDKHLEWADIVLTGGTWPQQKRILTIIGRAHQQKRLVAVGGVDPTSRPHVYQQADFLVLGEGEVTIPQFLEDLSKGATSGCYQSTQHADMTNAVVPRFDLIRFTNYVRVDVQLSRGCPYKCEFCAVIELFGRRRRAKTSDQIVTELQTLYELGYRGHINLVDDNFLESKVQGMNTLEAVRDWSKHHHYPFFFSTDTSIKLAKEERLLRLMQETDFRHVFVGIESADEDVLLQTQKGHHTGILMVDAVKTLNEHGMNVVAGFILGFDGETKQTAQNMVDLIQETGICYAFAGMLVALPLTQLWRRLELEARLFRDDWPLIASVEGDHTINGLNFATLRPRTDVMHDYMGMLHQIYAPEKYYERISRTADNLAPEHKHRPSLRTGLKRIWTFIKVSARAGLNKQTGLLYWKTILRTLIQKPEVVGVVVAMAALYVHFSRQVDFITRVLEEKIRYIASIGEERYNELMIASPRTALRRDSIGSGAPHRPFW